MSNRGGLGGGFKEILKHERWGENRRKGRSKAMVMG